MSSLTLSKQHFAFPGVPPALKPSLSGQARGPWNMDLIFSQSFFFFFPHQSLLNLSLARTKQSLSLANFSRLPDSQRPVAPLPCLLPGGHPRAGPSRARKRPGVGVTCRNNLLIPRSTVGSLCGSPVPRAQGRSPPTAQP